MDKIYLVLESEVNPKLRTVTAYFTPLRRHMVTKDMLPEEGLDYCYDTRHADENDWSLPVTVEPSVLVNHCGTIYLNKELFFGPSNQIKIKKLSWY